MNAIERSTALAAASACLFGGTLLHAGTVWYDNSDLAFTPVPYYYIPTPPYFSLYGPHTGIDFTVSPADNAAGNLSGSTTFYISMGRNPQTSSQSDFDRLERTFSPAGSLPCPALVDSVEFFDNQKGNIYFIQHARLFQEGDVIGLSQFTASDPDSNVRGPLSVWTFLDEPTLQRFVGDEAILGWSFIEPGGVRYGFVRLTWTEDVPYIRPSHGDTNFVDLYLPTAWGYSDTLDEPATVPNFCPADLDANGVLNVDDVDAFAGAFVGSDLLADIDGNGILNVDDVDAFVAAFAAGC